MLPTGRIVARGAPSLREACVVDARGRLTSAAAAPGVRRGTGRTCRRAARESRRFPLPIRLGWFDDQERAFAAALRAAKLEYAQVRPIVSDDEAEGPRLRGKVDLA